MSEQVTVNTATPTPDSDPAYVERMVAKAEGREPNAPAAAKEGDLILGKFKSQDDLVKAYTELEKKLGQGKPEAKPEDKPAAKPEANAEAKPEDKPQDKPEANPNDAAKALEGKGLDYTAFSAEYSEKGELSADSYAKLEKAGIPRDMVDAYIAGQKALADRARAEVFEVAGGEDNYAAAIEWAKANMSDADKAAYNKVVNGGDLNATKIAVQGLIARFRAAEGQEPNLLGGDAVSGDSDVYTSWAQITQDMAKPEYNSDPAYRKRVEQKVARSAL